jgi:hypothetical protein
MSLTCCVRPNRSTADALRARLNSDVRTHDMGFLSKLFNASSSRSMLHPVFGKLVLNRGKNGPYWLHEVYTGEESVSISIESPDGDEPTQAQVAFYQRVVSDLDVTVNSIREPLALRYKGMHRKELPADWTEAFKLAGVGVPATGDPCADWDISLECLTDRSGFLYNCYFKGAHLEHISVDT